MAHKLEVRGVGYAYHTMEGETPALSDISFTADTGEFIAVVGPSGCGKSTLLSLLCGLVKPESGSILIDQKPLEEAGDLIGYMLQKDHLFEWRTILSNVSLGLEIQKRLTPETQNELKEMLKTYGLEECQDMRPSQLSGGMRQRAALIRTLALKPDILLLDEPFSALDYQTRLAVCDDISTIIRKTKKTAVLVTHDLSEAISVADQIIVLSPRPARVKAIIPISFPKKNQLQGESKETALKDTDHAAPGRTESTISPMERRNTPEFSQYFNLIWKELKHDGA